MAAPALSCQRDHFDWPSSTAAPQLAYLNCAYLGPLPTRSKAAAKAAADRQVRRRRPLARSPYYCNSMDA